MKNLKSQLLLVTSVTLLAFNACSKDDGPDAGIAGSPLITEFGEPIGQADEVTIGPEGGIINSSDGLLSLSIPQGALSGSTVTSIQAISNQAPLGLGNGYRLGPEGLSFEKPVTLTFHYSEELLGQTPAEFLWIVFQESDGSWKAMLKSALNSNTKTLTVETSHFSDWSLGRFVDLSLNPVAAAVKKEDKVELAVEGFSKGEATSEDVDYPLIINNDEGLEFLSKNEFSWRIVEWTLNGVKSPVSNSNGSLQSTKNTASYTAPSITPEPNVVAVSVELETNFKGVSTTFYLTSNITIYESDLYLRVDFRGKTYIYYQYGFSGAALPDSNKFSIINCGLSENRLELSGATFVKNEVTDQIEIYFDNPFEGSRGMIGLVDDGEDDMNFATFNPLSYYNMREETRTLSGDNCYVEINESNHVTMTLTHYPGTLRSEVEGSFTGKLFYSDQSYETDCRSSKPYLVSGNFHMILQFL